MNQYFGGVLILCLQMFPAALLSQDNSKAAVVVTEESSVAKKAEAVKADSQYLLRAYRKEYAFLISEKKSLENRYQKLKGDYELKQKNLKLSISGLDGAVESLKKERGQKYKQLDELQEKNLGIEDVHEVMTSSIVQAIMSLENHHVSVPSIPSGKEKLLPTIDFVFDASINLLNEYSSIRVSDGTFFQEDGVEITGKIIRIGQIASLGVSDTRSGTLAPAGNGKLKLWSEANSADAKALAENISHGVLPIYTYSSLKSEAALVQEKSLEELIESGGVIAWIITWLGCLGAFLLVVRVIILMLSTSRTDKIIKEVTPLLQNGQLEDAKLRTSKATGVAAKIIYTTLDNIEKDAEHLENVIVESVLMASPRLDKFDAAIKVFAAVAPLLGLLGTVTGMIATFDVITTFGTGDPKMLSGGISEALVTTQLGLTVAIPLLVFGTLLSGWSERIKSSMEASALRITNIYKGLDPEAIEA